MGRSRDYIALLCVVTVLCSFLVAATSLIFLPVFIPFVAMVLVCLSGLAVTQALLVEELGSTAPRSPRAPPFRFSL